MHPLYALHTLILGPKWVLFRFLSVFFFPLPSFTSASATPVSLSLTGPRFSTPVPSLNSSPPTPTMCSED